MKTPEAIPVTSNKEAKSISKKVKGIIDLSKLKKKYLCQQCDYSSDYSANVRKHVEVVHEGFKRFGCDQCEYRNVERNKIEQHNALVHANEHNVPCERCNLKFKTRLHIRRHIKVVHERHRLAKCKQCDFTAIASCKVREHTRAVHEGLLSLACDVVDCDYRTYRQQNLKYHLLTKHLKRKVGTQHQCPRCDYSASTLNRLQDHVDFRHEKNFKYVCDICNCPKASQKALESHKKVVHEGIKDFAKCDKCDYTARSRSSVVEHTRAVHERSLSLACDVVDCEYRTDRSHNLKRHLWREHLKGNGRRQYQCPRCDHSIDSKKRLQDHVDFKHERNFKYICDICNCPSPSQRNLALHKKAVHEGIKDFVCDVIDCKYKTVLKHKLKKHFQVKHLNMKHDRKKCDSCDYSAKSKKSLQDHVDFKHEQNFKYVCDICNCSLLTQRNLESHKKSVHEGIKDFACDVVDCEFKTAYKPTLKIHAQAKHLNMKHDTNKCDSCDYSATTKKALQDHVDFIHEINFKYVCDTCKVPQPSQNKLESHKKKAHDGFTKFKCDICNLPQPSQKKLESHKKRVHCGLTKLKCDHCVSFTTNKKTDLEDHMSLAHLDDIEGQCSQCHYRTRSKKRMAFHVIVHKRRESKEGHSTKISKQLEKNNRRDQTVKLQQDLQDNQDGEEKKSLKALRSSRKEITIVHQELAKLNEMRQHQRDGHKREDNDDYNNNVAREEVVVFLEEEEVTFAIKVKEEEEEEIGEENKHTGEEDLERKKLYL